MDYYIDEDGHVRAETYDIDLTEIATESLNKEWADEELEEEIGSRIGSTVVSRDDVKAMVRKVRELQCS